MRTLQPPRFPLPTAVSGCSILKGACLGLVWAPFCVRAHRRLPRASRIDGKSLGAAALPGDLIRCPAHRLRRRASASGSPAALPGPRHRAPTAPVPAARTAGPRHPAGRATDWPAKSRQAALAQAEVGWSAHHGQYRPRSGTPTSSGRGLIIGGAASATGSTSATRSTPGSVLSLDGKVVPPSSQRAGDGLASHKNVPALRLG